MITKIEYTKNNNTQAEWVGDLPLLHENLILSLPGRSAVRIHYIALLLAEGGTYRQIVKTQ